MDTLYNTSESPDSHLGTPGHESQEGGINPWIITLALGAYVAATALISQRKLRELRDKADDAASKANARSGGKKAPELTTEERQAIRDYIDASTEPIEEE